jgi:hypothetical protein
MEALVFYNDPNPPSIRLNFIHILVDVCKFGSINTILSEVSNTNRAIISILVAISNLNIG